MAFNVPKPNPTPYVWDQHHTFLVLIWPQKQEQDLNTTALHCYRKKKIPHKYHTLPIKRATSVISFSRAKPSWRNCGRNIKWMHYHPTLFCPHLTCTCIHFITTDLNNYIFCLCSTRPLSGLTVSQAGTFVAGFQAVVPIFSCQQQS